MLYHENYCDTIFMAKKEINSHKSQYHDTKTTIPNYIRSTILKYILEWNLEKN